MTSKLDLGADYRTAREEVAALIRTLAPEQLAAAVPGCPGWSVHDVVSHLTGVANDAVNGRLRGMPEPAQTAAQVAERAATPTSIVLREWERTASQYEAVLSKASTSSVSTVVDVVVHEQDIRGAVGLPGNRVNPLIDRAVERTLEHFASKVESAGLPSVVVRDGEAVISGLPEAPVVYRTSVFEAFRAVYGRRSRSQIERRFSGTDEPGAYVPLLCVFGPAEEDIIE